MPNVSQTIQTLSKKENHFELSVYRGELTKKGITENFARIIAAFPRLPDEYFQILQEMLKDSKFNDNRLKDAVLNTIKTCIYPEPTIANFLSYDKSIKVYNYNQYLKLVDELGINIGDLYKSVRLESAHKPAWVHINDIAKYKLILWNK